MKVVWPDSFISMTISGGFCMKTGHSYWRISAPCFWELRQSWISPFTLLVLSSGEKSLIFSSQTLSSQTFSSQTFGRQTFFSVNYFSGKTPTVLWLTTASPSTSRPSTFSQTTSAPPIQIFNLSVNKKQKSETFNETKMWKIVFSFSLCYLQENKLDFFLFFWKYVRVIRFCFVHFTWIFNYGYSIPLNQKVEERTDKTEAVSWNQKFSYVWLLCYCICLLKGEQKITEKS